MRLYSTTLRHNPQIAQITQIWSHGNSAQRPTVHELQPSACFPSLLRAVYLRNLCNLRMLLSRCPPLHVLVGAKLFDNHETKSLVKTVRIVIEHEDHVAQGLARPL